MLLSILLLKVCALSISHFSSSGESFAVEKNTEEGKDSKEEATDKYEKKMFTCVFSYLEHGHPLWINYLPLNRYAYTFQIGSHPVKTVPTPPPDILV